MDSLIQDITYALRGLARNKGFTAIVIATLALGIGANAAIFSVVSGILLRPLPYPHAERVFSFGHQPPQWLTSQPDFLDYRRDMRSLEGLAAYIRNEATITGTGDPERLRVARVGDGFFRVLGVTPRIGREFVDEEFIPRPGTAIILSEELLQRRFGGDRSIVGSKLIIDGVPRIVVGIMPPRFGFPEARTDAWLPLQRFNPDSLDDRANHYLFMVGRVKPGVTIERAQGEAAAIARGIMRDHPENFDPTQPLVPNLTGVGEELVGKTRPYLFALLGAVGFVLLIACANVANLLLVRGESRRKEMALRSALGASRKRLVSQLLTESALLCLLGASLGLGVAWALDRALLATAPSSIPRLAEIGIDWRVLAFTLVAALFTSVLVGLFPAWRLAMGTLRGRSRSGARRVLVAAEVALAVVTLSGAGMLLRSLWNLQSAGLGFEPRGVLTARVSISARDYDDARATLFYDDVLRRIRALPGVRSAGASGWLPVVDAGGLWGYRVEGQSYAEGRWPSAVPQQATPGWVASIGLRMLAGRDFTDADRESAPFVAVVSKQFAEASWPNQNAIGKRFRLGGDSPFRTVVGIVDDIRARGFGDTPEPTMYFPYAQAAKSAYYQPRALTIIARVESGTPTSIARALASIIHSADATAPVTELRTLEQVVGTSVATRRFNTTLLTAFAALALVLAGIGTYGVISYGVSERRYEIGVRMALGADQRSVLGLVLVDGLAMCAAGLVAGVLGSMAVGRLIAALLVGVTWLDAPALLLASGLLVVVGLIAIALPARRAMTVSPVEALR